MDISGIAWSHRVHSRILIVPDERRVGKTVLNLTTRGSSPGFRAEFGQAMGTVRHRAKKRLYWNGPVGLKYLGKSNGSRR